MKNVGYRNLTSYQTLSKSCKLCGNKISYKQFKLKNEFCSSSCAFEYNNKLRNDKNEPISNEIKKENIRFFKRILYKKWTL